ncbi:unnamed protein product [Diamesa hyperborea]
MKCLVLLLLIINLVFARQYERCELAKELYDKHDIKLEKVGMLVCFAEWSSNLQTTKYSYGNYGLFQLNGDWWCSKDDDTEDGCDMKCTDLIDDDITDDVKCAKRIMAVNGLNALGLTHQCLPKASEIVNQCFPNELDSGETQHVIVKDESVDPEESDESEELFQNVSDLLIFKSLLNGDWWCSKEDGIEDGCDMNCTDLIDDDITDDVKCIKQIISVQGLDAWGLNRQCLPKASEIVNQCFPNELHSGETQHVIVKDESEESVQHHENPDFQELFDVNSFVT